MGSAPHQGACADLNRGCTWACRRLRRACSCSVRVSSASCGVHCASTCNVLRRASTVTDVLGASACSLCRTHCYRNRWLRFSPCRVHCVHLHLWWRTSRRHKQCLTRRRFLSRRHMSDDVFLRQGVDSNALLSLSWSIPFLHSCCKVSITKLTRCAAHALWAMRRTRVLALT